METKQSSRRLRRAALAGPWRVAALGTVVLASAGEGAALAAPIKVACIGEHTTHSDHFPALNRESQPAGMQEYPAMLQTLLGAGYQVRNFGDCCGTVTQGYTPMETHPYVLGALAGRGPAYTESIAFVPDIVIIGSWGRHDWGMAKATTETWSAAKFETDYDDLVQRYQKLASHPLIFVSLPIPIPYGQAAPATGVATSSVLPGIQRVADKYRLPVIDLYSRFLGHRELFKQPPDMEGEGEHVTDGPGLHAIADAVYAAMMAYQADGGVADAGAGGQDGAGTPHETQDPPTTTGQPDSGSAGAGGSPPDGATSAGGTGGAGAGGIAGGMATGTAGSAGGAPTGSPQAGAHAGSGCACSSAGSATAAGGRWLAFPWAALLMLTRRRQTARRRSPSSMADRARRQLRTPL